MELLQTRIPGYLQRIGERGLGMRGANCSLPDPNQTIVQEGDQEGNGGGRGGT